MTAPNMIGTTVIKGESNVKTTLTTSPITIVFNQVDSNQVYKVNNIVVSNIDGTNTADVTVKLARQGVDYSIISTASVPADASLIAASKETCIYLEEGDAIQAFASANDDLDISISYETVSETANTLITRGLVLYLDAADLNSYPGSGTTWYDLSTGANDGTLTNGPTFSSNNDGVIVFDGTDDYVNTGLPANTTFTSSSDFTIDCWFNMIGQGSDTVGTLIGGFNFQGYGLYWYESITNTLHVVAQMRTATEVLSLDYDPISTNTWYHATQVYSSSSNTHILYLNGSSVRSGNAASDAYNTNLNGYFITIGSDDEAGGTRAESFLDGKISNVKIYNRALSADEVLQNFNAVKDRFGL